MPFFTAKEWKQRRDYHMIAARECREALTNPEGYWKLQPDDARVKEAMRFWVVKARRAHRISLGREPMIENFLYITSNQAIQGALYAQ